MTDESMKDRTGEWSFPFSFESTRFTNLCDLAVPKFHH